MRILIAHSFYRQLGVEDRYVAQQTALLEQAHAVRVEARENAELEAGLVTAARMIENVTERDSPSTRAQPITWSNRDRAARTPSSSSAGSCG